MGEQLGWLGRTASVRWVVLFVALGGTQACKPSHADLCKDEKLTLETRVEHCDKALGESSGSEKLAVQGQLDALAVARKEAEDRAEAERAEAHREAERQEQERLEAIDNGHTYEVVRRGRRGKPTLDGVAAKLGAYAMTDVKIHWIKLDSVKPGTVEASRSALAEPRRFPASIATYRMWTEKGADCFIVASGWDEEQQTWRRGHSTEDCSDAAKAEIEEWKAKYAFQ